MSLKDLPALARRAVIRETAGRALRDKQARADETERIAELVMLRGNPEHLQPEHFIKAAERLDLRDPATLHAVADAESDIGGFDPKCSGRPIIAVECHAFSDATSHAWDIIRPDVSYPEFTRYERGKPPPKGMEQHPYTLSQDGRWALFARQAELSVDGALCALSVGRFQPLIGRTPAGRRAGRRNGWEELGFVSPEAMFRYVASSEYAQLEVLCAHLVAHGLTRAFRERDWRAIARGYNGSAQVELYATKMAAAHKRRTRIYA
jgi:hypothetical protein